MTTSTMRVGERRIVPLLVVVLASVILTTVGCDKGDDSSESSGQSSGGQSSPPPSVRQQERPADRTHSPTPAVSPAKRTAMKHDLSKDASFTDSLVAGETHRYTSETSNKPRVFRKRHPYSGKTAIVGDHMGLNLYPRNDGTTLVLRVADDSGRVLAEQSVSGRSQQLHLDGGVAVNCRLNIDAFERSGHPAEYEIIIRWLRSRYLEGNPAQGANDYDFIVK